MAYCGFVLLKSLFYTGFQSSKIVHTSNILMSMHNAHFSIKISNANLLQSSSKILQNIWKVWSVVQCPLVTFFYCKIICSNKHPFINNSKKASLKRTMWLFSLFSQAKEGIIFCILCQIDTSQMARVLDFNNENLKLMKVLFRYLFYSLNSLLMSKSLIVDQWNTQD